MSNLGRVLVSLVRSMEKAAVSTQWLENAVRSAKASPERMAQFALRRKGTHVHDGLAGATGLSEVIRRDTANRLVPQKASPIARRLDDQLTSAIDTHQFDSALQRHRAGINPLNPSRIPMASPPGADNTMRAMLHSDPTFLTRLRRAADGAKNPTAFAIAR